jgi:hypothetical protein
MDTHNSFNELVQIYYASKQICLFTGGGVSSTQDEHYCAPGWKTLLYEVYAGLHLTEREVETKASFEQMARKHHDLWDLASAIRKDAEYEKHFTRMVRAAIVKRNEGEDQDKRLKRKNLRGATTLNSVISFCSRVREINIHPCFEINPKIAAVITANYDRNLESGATTKHQANRFKPMTRPASTVENALAVYHIHGYFPYDKKKESGVDLILDRESYKKAYENNGWPPQILHTFLEHFPTLFIGFSFDDRFLLRELRNIARKPRTPSHYALMFRDEDRSPGLLEKIEDARIKIIFYDKHSEIPDLLYRVYFGDVAPHKKIDIPHRKTLPKPYNTETVWKMLLDDKEWLAESNTE